MNSSNDSSPFLILAIIIFKHAQPLWGTFLELTENGTNKSVFLLHVQYLLTGGNTSEFVGFPLVRSFKSFVRNVPGALLRNLRIH